MWGRETGRPLSLSLFTNWSDVLLDYCYAQSVHGVLCHKFHEFVNESNLYRFHNIVLLFVYFFVYSRPHHWLLSDLKARYDEEKSLREAGNQRLTQLTEQLQSEKQENERLHTELVQRRTKILSIWISLQYWRTFLLSFAWKKKNPWAQPLGPLIKTMALLCPLAAAARSGGCWGSAEGAGAGADADGPYVTREGGGVWTARKPLQAAAG